MASLFVVATPIGNLSDMTLRAIEVLKNVNYILSEDTRETDKLLKHYSIQNPQLSYRDQNHTKILPKIIDALENGLDLALVSDSGTPAISDPGFKLISEIIKLGYKVIPIPGPCSATSALSVSGLPTDKYIFLGFLPKKSGQRQKMLETYGKLEATLVIYESPFRVKNLLEEIMALLGNRTVCLAKDMTKLYEDIQTAKVEDLLKGSVIEKGEYVVLIAKEGF